MKATALPLPAALLPIVALGLVSVWSAAPAAAVTPLAQDTDVGRATGTSMFGEPVVVNGRRITDLALKRYLCYGKASNGLAAHKLQIMIEHEREYRAATYFEDFLEEDFPGKLEDELSAAHLLGMGVRARARRS